MEDPWGLGEDVRETVLSQNGARLIDKTWAERDFPSSWALPRPKSTRLLAFDLFLTFSLFAVAFCPSFEFALVAYQFYCFFPLAGPYAASYVFTQVLFLYGRKELVKLVCDRTSSCWEDAVSPLSWPRHEGVGCSIGHV